jgi:potassium-dependent mechanosensitive channel
MDKTIHSELWDGIVEFWNFILWEFEQYEVTVKKVMIAIVIFFIFIFIAKLIQRVLRNRFVKNNIFNDHALLAINRVTMCLFIVMGLFSSLRIIHIPISAFAFLGGGLAIGFGFGAKQMISNLISGFIIMFEKPVKLGDFVEFDGDVGNVVDIGIRCTRIRTINNLEILIPNSDVIENKISNWSRLTNNIRTNVSIGIGYDSDIHKATELMLEAVKKCSKVVETPEPFIIFREHGNSTLNFDVYFTVKAKNNIQKIKLESEINYNLNDVLRAANIQIAYPQRDVHLDIKHPIDINIKK